MNFVASKGSQSPANKLKSRKLNLKMVRGHVRGVVVDAEGVVDLAIVIAVVVEVDSTHTICMAVMDTSNTLILVITAAMMVMDTTMVTVTWVTTSKLLQTLAHSTVDMEGVAVQDNGTHHTRKGRNTFFLIFPCLWFIL